MGALVGAACLVGLLAACSSSSSSTVVGGSDATVVDGMAGVLDSGPRDSSPDADATTAPDGSTDDAGEAGVQDAPTGSVTDCLVGDAGESVELRCTGLYSDWASRTVSADVHQFDPGLHLWSDGAVKTRWIYLPPDPAGDGGTRLPIDTSDMNEWTFPVGTKFWKEFVLGGKRIETRLLWKQGPSSWYRTTYRWSSDESSTTELTVGELNADGNGYEVPSQGACLTCHGGRVDDVLGFDSVSLSSANATPFTMQTLAAQGWITKLPEAGIVIPGSAIDVAALGYLHANCGEACHNSRNGLAQRTGFFMRLQVEHMSSVQATDTWQTGVNQRAFFTPPGATSPLTLLAPGDAGASCVVYRMSHRTGVNDAGPGLQMPPIDTHKVDEAGVSLIAQWIDEVLPTELDGGPSDGGPAETGD